MTIKRKSQKDKLWEDLSSAYLIHNYLEKSSDTWREKYFVVKNKILCLRILTTGIAVAIAVSTPILIHGLLWAN